MSLAQRGRERDRQGVREGGVRPSLDSAINCLSAPWQGVKYFMKKLRFSSNQCAIKIKLKFSKSREREVWETRTEQDTSGHTCVKAITLLLWGNCPRRRPRSRSQRNWGQLLLKVSGLIKNAFGQEEEEEEAEENVTWLVFFDFYCIPLPPPLPALLGCLQVSRKLL